MRGFILAGALALVLANALSASAAPTPQPEGGANQRASVEGCMNQWLFDGVWRVRVTRVTPGVAVNAQDKDVEVWMNIRNGYNKSLTPPDSGFATINGGGMTLAYSDDTTQGVDFSYTNYGPEAGYKKLPPGGAATTRLLFKSPTDPTATPTKLLIEVDPKVNPKEVHYSVKDPSFRIRLDCTK